MKNLLFTLLLACFAGTLFAQNPPCMAFVWPIDYDNGVTTLSAVDSSGSSVASYIWSNGATTPTIDVAAEGEYCVTITFESGCTASSCYTLNNSDCWSYATYWPTATAYSVSAYGAPYYLGATYQWSNGVTASSFVTTVPGEYCVTITRENGCTSTSCVTIPNVNPPQTNCYVQITRTGYDNGTTTLAVIDSFSTNTATYEWSTGETTSTIEANGEGVFCVTATFPDGCIATACDTLSNSNCDVYVSAGNTPTGVVAYAIHYPSYLDATYLWSNGATTSQITATISGQYCVTVTSENGCTAVDCVTVEINNEVNIYVQNVDSLTNGINAYVYLIEYDAATGILSSPLSAPTTVNGSGHAQFQDVPPGQYLVKAAVIPGTVGYTENLPTYYGDVLLWSDATYLNVPLTGWSTAVIHLIQGDNPGGPGFIGGFVSEGANLTGHNTEAEFSGEGDPISGASIILTLPDGTAVAHATTNAAGEYSFPSLPYGTYVVTINIIGIDPVSTTVTLSPAQPGFSGINFDVNQNGAVLAAEEVGYEAFTSVAPNPAHDVIRVTLKKAEGMLLLTNAQGQIVQRQAVNGSQMQLSIAALPPGTYFLTAATSKGSKSVRIIKQ